MTTQNGNTTTSPLSIESLDAFARQLYRRARSAGPTFANLAATLRSLHTVVRHLRAEAEDPDSLLNSPARHGGPDSSPHGRQLSRIIEDCDFTLKQLETILERYRSSGDPNHGHPDFIPPGGPGPSKNGAHVDSQERDMVTLIQSKLASQKTDIDLFLDTVQLHNPARPRGLAEPASYQQLDAIKDKVDEIGARLFQGRASTGSDDESDDELWQQFHFELEKSGFSSDVLHRNKVSPSARSRSSNIPK